MATQKLQVRPGYKKFKIKKKSGGYREIYAPNRQTKAKQRLMVPRLTVLAKQVCNMDVVHGFMPMRSPVTNARMHIGYKFTLSFDLESFFDTVTEDHVMPRVNGDQEIKRWCFAGEAARQGFPTSPIVSNIAASSMDQLILDVLAKHSEKVVYTRYADDLTFSFNNKETVDHLKIVIPIVVESCKFKVNPKKTRCQWSGFGRRIITGVAVDDTGIHPTRSVRRRLRAALHQQRMAEAGGLAEWCKLRPPNPMGPKCQSKVTACMLRRMDRLQQGIPDKWC